MERFRKVPGGNANLVTRPSSLAVPAGRTAPRTSAAPACTVTVRRSAAVSRAPWPSAVFVTTSSDS